MVNLHDDKAEPEIVPNEPAKDDSFVPPEEVAASDVDTSAEEPVDVPKKSFEVPVGPKQNKLTAFFAGYWAKKKWTLPLSLVVIVGVLLAIPQTRYASLGLVLKAQVNVAVVDSKTATPVSGAAVSFGGQTLKTDASGKASGKVNLGSKTVEVTKQYYQSTSQAVVVTFSKQHNSFKVSLVATGRQVPIKVVNKITGKPLAGAQVKVLNTEAKTDKNGTATIVLPTTSATQKAAVSLSGYNTLAATVTVTDKALASNTFSLTPSGTIYFLSKRTGTINVMKSDLDGSNAVVVLAGTGKEEDTDTILLASQDWKYLALKSRRSDASKPASLYLIDTTKGDKLTTIDEGDVQLTLSGWSGHRFVYTVLRNSVAISTPNRQSLKSYDAEGGQLATLDSTDASGTNPYDYQLEVISNVAILDTTVVYTKTWQKGYYTAAFSGRQQTFNSISASGQNKKTLKSFDANAVNYINGSVYSPSEAYYSVYPNDSSPTQYYEIEGGTFKTSTADAVQKADGQYTTYLSSPDNSKTFWYEARDGKNTLFVGDQDGKNGQEIGTLTEFVPYGWYGQSYLLVSKNSSELYIFGVDGLNNGALPLKITDYHKPAVDFTGYGKGYGGF